MTRYIGESILFFLFSNTANTPVSLLYHICSKCKDWAEADIVQVIVRVQHEMSGIETDIEIVCNKVGPMLHLALGMLLYLLLRQIGILSQTRLVEDRERDNNKDLDHLIQKTMDLLSHKEFRDACLALKNNQAEDMMKFIHEVSVLFESLLRALNRNRYSSGPHQTIFVAMTPLSC